MWEGEEKKEGCYGAESEKGEVWSGIVTKQPQSKGYNVRINVVNDEIYERLVWAVTPPCWWTHGASEGHAPTKVARNEDCDQ